LLINAGVMGSEMGVWIQIESGSSRPIYAQIVTQVEQAVATGELQPGDRLPPVRRLAEEIVVNPNTVAKAYSLMEQGGLVETRKGSGTFVADPAARSADARDLNLLGTRMDTIISRGLSLGLDDTALRDMFRERLARFRRRRRRAENE
jgi:GntR family transcriptional regulator